MLLSYQTIIISIGAAILLSILGIIFSIIAFVKVKNVRNDLIILFSGKKAADLEDIILAHTKNISQLDKEIQELFEISNKIHALASRSVHKVGIVRFNPFKDIGGDQSFAIALLDGKNSGIVISSLHTREGTRIYSKPVEKGEAGKYSLTSEEYQAIKEATANKPAKI
jgi:hypothetical protein